MATTSTTGSVCSDVTAGTSDVFDFMSECGECNKLDDLTLTQKAQLCCRLKESVSVVQKSSLNQEKEEANQRAGEQFALCETCHLVEDSRERKQAEIRQLHLQILANKPADLLCTPGIFSRLEKMASKGRLDAVGVAEGSRCSECRQVSDNASVRVLLKSDIISILQEDLGRSALQSGENCCIERACSKCLQYVISMLGGVPPTPLNQEILRDETVNNTISQVPINTADIQDNFKDLSEKFNLLLSELKTCNNQNQGFQDKNVSCLQDVCHKLDSLNFTEVNKSDEGVKIKISRNLSPFSGEPWESPHLAVKMWEQNLKLSKTPEPDWVKLICEVLTGPAKAWLDNNLKVVENTFEEFADEFVGHFDKNMKNVVDDYIKQVVKTGSIFFFDNNKFERFLLACLRALNDDIRSLTAIFNAQLIRYPMLHKNGNFALASVSSNTLLELFTLLNSNLATSHVHTSTEVFSFILNNVAETITNYNYLTKLDQVL